jgi:carboxyl-terminal processing protease
VPAGLAERAEQLTDVVLEHHIDPPARQQMLLSGLKALNSAAGATAPVGLSRRVSAVTTRAQLAAILAEAWPKSTAPHTKTSDLAEQFLRGLLAPVSGNCDLIPERDRRVQEQTEGNRYVGIHVALMMDDNEKRPTMRDVIEGGPADRAGIKRDDLLDEIDGVDTKGKTLREVIDRLRGEEGASVTIKVRSRNAPARAVTLTRSQHPRASIKGLRRRPDGAWDLRLSQHDAIGYLRCGEIMASTPHELRMLAPRLESEGMKALVLDLRGLYGNSPHIAVLLADALLAHGPIGRIRTNRTETNYEADADALFRGWPLAVLVDESTSGAAEWLAAALQDNHRAVVVGTPTASARMNPGIAVATSVIPVGNSDWSVSLATGVLERGDGSPLSRFDGARPSAFVASPAPSRFGVHPDQAVAENAAGPAARAAQAGAAQTDGNKPDAAQLKALELLRQALKSS